jgi:hypothetical protein
MLELLEQALILEKDSVVTLRQKCKEQSVPSGGKKSVLVKNILQPPPKPEKKKTPRKQRTRRPIAEDPLQPKGPGSGSKQSKDSLARKQRETIQELEAEKESQARELAKLQGERDHQVAMNKVQVEAAKHATEARMRKAELDALVVANQVALEMAHKTMPADLARQLIGTQAIALGGFSMGPGQTLSTPLLGLKEFTVEQVIEFVTDLGKPFHAYREALEESCVDGELLAVITEKELETAIMVQNPLHRRKILNAVSKRCQSA